MLVGLLAISLMSGGVYAQAGDDTASAASADGSADAQAVSATEVVPDTEAVARSSTVEQGPDNAGETKAEEAAGREEFLKDGKAKPQLTITSLSPSHGPVTGDTRVVVRGGPFARWALVYPEPKCRFGNNTMIVTAAYISCSPKARGWAEKEANKKERTDTCVQCEGSPPSIESKPVEFSVSLTGDFSDITSTGTFYYYKSARVKNIKPIHGPKDGDTLVEVWGDNFVNYGEQVTCSFGTKSVKASVHNANYITCSSPPSDVVQRGMPFGVALNGQQQTKDPVDYWYYNQPQVTVAEPASGPGPGPESGGNEVVVRGNNFQPFHPDQGDPDIKNSTRCAFTALDGGHGVWTPATVLNSTRAICIAPAARGHSQTPVEITLNAQDWTDDGTLYYYYKPPFLFDVQPRQGPLRGGTNVTVMGTNFNRTGHITCRFGHKEAPAELRSSSEIRCQAPAYLEPGTVELSISLLPGLYSSPVAYLYYESPVVTAVSPPCGPEAGFTQLTVTGTNFRDLGSDLALCVFNKTIFTNATVISDTEIICDSPSILNKHGYVDISEGSTAMYQV